MSFPTGPRQPTRVLYPEGHPPRRKPQKHGHVWQWSIHDAMEWCGCGEARPTLTEQEMEDVPAEDQER
jgi:hypothetical protein